MRRLSAVLIGALAALAIGAVPAGAAVGLKDFDVTFTQAPPEGSEPGTLGPAETQAGSHPFAMTTSLEANTKEAPEGGTVPDEAVRNLTIAAIPGLVGNPTAVPPCSTIDFLSHPESAFVPDCADSSAIGYGEFTVGQAEGTITFNAPAYNLEPAPGKAAKIGFLVSEIPVSIDLALNESPPYNVLAVSRNVTQVLEFFSAEVTIWGDPGHPANDPLRGRCLIEGGSCPAAIGRHPFLTAPRACEGSLLNHWEVDSWENPGVWVKGSAPGEAMTGCDKLGFAPQIEAQPTSLSAESPTGLDFDLEIDDEGIDNPTGLADSDLKKAVVTLPEGMTVNPSQAEGLEVCSEAALAEESSSSAPGAGCPQASKIGSVEVETPLLEERVLKGALFVAEPYKNPFDSLLAIYMTIKEPERGISVKLAGKVEPHPRTGQLIATFGDPSATDPAFREIPQAPVSEFRLHFREGARSPLITPPSCDSNPSTPTQDPYTVDAVFTPWANPQNPYETSADFEVSSGVNGGPCPPSGPQPFKPSFVAGSINGSGGAHSPFFMRLTRRDGDQDLTRFSSVLPKGLVAKLAGVSECPEVQIALARTKSGREELASPSCPANSLIGHVQAGAGVGSQLTYVPGKVYLAGPTKGAPLSVVGIVPAVAGPFDVGTVVTHFALRVDPRSAEVTVDGAASDPIPHILAGIPLRVRDIQVHVDRPAFTLNPTNCAPTQTTAQLWGGGIDPFSSADDAPLSLADRFQAADCARLGFKPRLQLRLKGGTKRGGHPALRAVVTPRPGDANFAGAVVTLPKSAFLDQAHIRTICTRVQFAADACPKGAAYGFAKAWSPLLDAPLEGPAYLRSSENELPDLVADLRGRIDVELVGRIDSHKGGIRSTFEAIPDAPVSRFLLSMEGGKKGLIVNSRDLCAKRSRATVRFTAQNGRRHNFAPQVKAQCPKGRKAKRRAKRHPPGE